MYFKNTVSSDKKTCKKYMFYIYDKLTGPKSHYKFHKG